MAGVFRHPVHNRPQVHVVAIGQNLGKTTVPAIADGGITISSAAVRYWRYQIPHTTRGEIMALFNREEKQPLSTYQDDTASGAAEPVNDLASSVGSGESTPTAPAPLVDSAVDVESRLKSLARQIAGSKKKLVANVLAIGESLTEAQDLLANHNGGAFTRWVRQRCGFTTKTAYRYLSAWRTFGGCDTVSQRRFELSAMYLLAHDSAPEPAVDEALELASNGEKVTTKTAREIIAKYAPKTVSSKPGRPEPILLEDAQAVVTIRPLSEGVDICGVLSRLLKEQLAKRKEAA